MIDAQEKKQIYNKQTIYVLKENKVASHFYMAEAFLKLNKINEARKEYEIVINLTDPGIQKNLTDMMSEYRRRAQKMLKDLN